MPKLSTGDLEPETLERLHKINGPLLLLWVARRRPDQETPGGVVDAPRARNPSHFVATSVHANHKHEGIHTTGFKLEKCVYDFCPRLHWVEEKTFYFHASATATGTVNVMTVQVRVGITIL